MEVRYFTVDQANRALPLVRRIVADLVDEYGRWCDTVDRYELIAAGSRGDRPEPPEQVEARRTVEESAGRIESLLDELGQVGCVCQGFEEGLVDFYTKREGRDVFLCWKLGEPAVTHWHEVHGGFAARQVLG